MDLPPIGVKVLVEIGNSIFIAQLGSEGKFHDCRTNRIFEHIDRWKPIEIKDKRIYYGIYAIIFSDDNIYIGSTIDSFERRWQDHRKDLRQGCHSNYMVQDLYDRYNHQCEFKILEAFDLYAKETKEYRKERVIDREQEIVDSYSRTHTVLNLITPG